MAEKDRLLSGWVSLTLPRGFESLPLRQITYPLIINYSRISKRKHASGACLLDSKRRTEQSEGVCVSVANEVTVF